MKVRTWVEFETEVEVNVSVEDVTAMLVADERDTPRAALMGLNNCAVFMRAIPDSAIAEMNDKQRALVGDFLREQVARYASPPQIEQPSITSDAEGAPISNESSIAP